MKIENKFNVGGESPEFAADNLCKRIIASLPLAVLQNS